MCGICGKYSPGGVQQPELQKMADALIHRGPDDEGFYLNGTIGLGSRRLSIIDPEGGHMPIANEDQSVWTVYNGEIYNYKLLRKELQDKGHIFKTGSDTEIIVHLYEELGERCVERLRGMFALVIWDANQQKLVMARDRIGQKPLFYAQEGEELLFASEIKAILTVSQYPREINFEAIHHYLSLRFIPSPQTMLRHIKKLPPAHILVYQNGQTTVSRYWELSFYEKLDLPEAVIIERLREKLIQTLESHLISDVPVGAFLSGGMDSSMIVAMMARDLESSFNTFAVGVAEQDFNELPYARAVAERYHTNHTEATVNANLMQLLPKIIWHLDEPSDPIAACQFHAAALAADHVKVVLGGDGGDELFAGFDRYAGVGYIDYYNLIPGFLREHLLEPLIARIPDRFGYKNVSQKLRWMHQLSGFGTIAERYAGATCFFRFDHQQKKALFGDELWRQVGYINSANIIVEQYNRAPAHDPIDRMLYADYQTRLPEHSLMLTDRMSMAHGLELRSPFLDHELVAFMATCPHTLKIHGRQLKYILRKLAGEYLPPEIVRRKKQGFMLPVAYWFRNELYPFLKNYLLSSQLVREGVFCRDMVLSLLEEHRHHRVDHHVRLWMLLNLELWYQIYIEHVQQADVSKQMQEYL
jgi:asparagine synthase (glutamine-hydrolysing)